MYMSIGQCGSVLGSHLFPSVDGPRYMCVMSCYCPLLPLMPIFFAERDSQVSVKNPTFV